MVDNQHKKISGYRDLTEEEIKKMNLIKAVAGEVEIVMDYLQQDPETDKRWVAVARTDLQKGFMAAVRSVAQPEGF